MVPSPESRKSKYQTQFQPLMSRCKDMVLVYVSALLTELFANTDKALMSFAQKAENDLMQNRFFEAISLIRNRHGLVEHEFRVQLSAGFDNFWARKPDSDPFSDLSSDIELELVDDDSMDQTTAIENMVSKATIGHRSQLYALSQRLAVINGGEAIEKNRTPASPQHLVDAFASAIDSLNLESNIKLIVLALFNKYVLKQLGSLYEDFNNTLKDAGVLPHLRPTIRNPQAAGQRGGKADKFAQQTEDQNAATAEQDLGEELFDSIVGLLASRRSSSPHRHPAARQGSGSGSAGRVSGTSRHSGGGQLPTTANLVSALNDIQPATRSDYLPDASTDAPFIPNIELDEQFLTRIKQTLIEERNKLYSQIDTDQLDTVDEDTIDLVGMLFEYMLNDPVLPAVAKALISHLHTPYLKVAIIDRHLLTDSNHDARQLLDCLVEAGSHWIDEHNLKRGIYPDMQSVVDHVLKEFSDNIKLFSDLLTNFKARMDDFRRKTEVLEKRAQDSARGREKLNDARQRAGQEMKARTFGASLPQVARDFLVQTWTDKLIFILLRHPDGEMSEDWKDALHVADELAWVFEEKKTQDERRELEKTLPYLRNTIEEGLESLGGYHQEKSRALFELLANAESAMSAGSSAVSEPKSVSTPKAAAAKPFQTTYPEPPVPVSEPTESKEQISDDLLKMMDKLRKTEFGTWFDLSSGPNDVKRVKLSWLSPLTSSCMFVDRAGVQTAIKPLRKLAQEIMDGKSKILEESNDPFVERTLHAIRRMLQRSLKATEAIAEDITNDNETGEDAWSKIPGSSYRDPVDG